MQMPPEILPHYKISKGSTIGLITYNSPHLKTEQVFHRIFSSDYFFKFLALPFSPRKKREPLISHRPNQLEAAHPADIANRHNIPYIPCNSYADIDHSCDLYLILGAGILPKEFILDKKIINCHPGIIPISRGLDSFKWSLHDNKPLGITLHYIDSEVDSGEIISVVQTPIYKSDTIETLSRRHYELEIETTSRFLHYIEHPVNPFESYPSELPHKRMPIEIERQVASNFDRYKEIFC